ncbi:MAG: trypsin-like peptidase domain-containing protein [Patescibacteria group bacterium]|nr:trypsin-like peptidase domain-containing protein [Patescibacteria group bacterium]
MNKNRIFLIGIVATALIVGISIGSAIGTPRAEANGVTDFFGSLLNPFGPSATGTQVQSANSVAANNSGSGSGAANSNPSAYQSSNSYEQAVINAVKTASPAVVSILVSQQVPVLTQCPYNPFQNLPPEFQQFFGNQGGGFTTTCPSGQTQLQQVGGGSGFIISSDGLILTNKHVVSDSSASYTVITNDGKKYSATVLARDPVQDLAVVKINATGLPTVRLGDSGSLQLGQTAIAIGNALGQFSNTVSVGVISGLERTVTAGGGLTGGTETLQGVLQTDAAINPGNSGGPLIDLNGDVVGINTAVAENAQGIGFAIPINRAKNDINSVETTGNISAPYLGVRYAMITPDLASSLNLSVQNGALLRGSSSTPAVQPGSPAAKAGLQAGDIITAVNGQQLDTTNDLATTLSQYKVGQTVTLSVNRSGQTMNVQVTLAERPAGM